MCFQGVERAFDEPAGTVAGLALEPAAQLLRFDGDMGLELDVRLRPITAHVSISALPGAG
jgi:hypothetical protein